MKTLRIFFLVSLFLTIADFSFGQKIRTETFSVSGECGMCKKKIEAYNSLAQCCQYARENRQASCCGSKCEMSKGSGGKDGKCIHETACKDTDAGICKDMACCKKTQ